MIDIEKIRELALAAAGPGTIDGHPFALVPETYDVESLEKFRSEPTRIRRRLETETVDAFLAYHEKWKLPDTELFACRDDVTFLAIIDAPTVSAGGLEDAHGPSWTDHRVLYSCPYSREWEAWTENDRVKLSQVQFAEFLEDHARDVTSPDGTDLLSLCTQLQIIRKATFAQGTVLASGEHNLTYSEDNAPGTVEIPSQITLGIPIFRGGEAYAIKARFKYRLNNGQLHLFYELVEPERYVDDAFDAIEDRIKTETEEPVLRVTQLP